MPYSWLDRNIKWVYTLPAVLFVLLMMVFPIIYTVRLSFYEWSMSASKPPLWVGFDNYWTLFTDARFWKSVGVGSDGLIGFGESYMVATGTPTISPPCSSRSPSASPSWYRRGCSGCAISTCGTSRRSRRTRSPALGRTSSVTTTCPTTSSRCSSTTR